LLFDTNNELYKSQEDLVESITLDWLAQNLYVLLRNRKTQEQTVVLLDIRTHKRRLAVKHQRIQPSTILIDPAKAELYWISQQSRVVLNIANLQGQLKGHITLATNDASVTYAAYDSVTHELIYVIDSTIYGLNTLDRFRASPRIIYEHSSTIQQPMFISPILHFTVDQNRNETGPIVLHAIDIVAKSYAKNIARFANFEKFKLFLDLAPTMPNGKDEQSLRLSQPLFASQFHESMCGSSVFGHLYSFGERPIPLCLR
jgi:hypothetical protein